MPVTGPVTGFTVTDPNTGNATDLGSRYVSKDYLISAYPNIVPGRTTPKLFTWGSNNVGQLGTNSVAAYTSSPVQVGSLTTWKSLAFGDNFAMALKNDGTMYAWGMATPGIIGNSGNNGSYSAPVQVGSQTNWKSMSAGESNWLAINTLGQLWACGYNTNGRLGNGTVIPYSSPIQIGSLTNWKQVSTGYFTSAAIKTDGTLWVWGYNNYGALGNSTIINYSSPIQVGGLANWKQVDVGTYHMAATKTDGTLWIWGGNMGGALGNSTIINYSSPIQVGGLANWKQVYTGSEYTMAIKTDGTLWAWGYNDGQLGLGIVANVSSPVQVGTLTNWKQVSCMRNAGAPQDGFTFLLKTDGTLWTCGYNSPVAGGNLGLGVSTSVTYSSPVQIGSLTTWKAIPTSLGFFTGGAITDGYI